MTFFSHRLLPDVRQLGRSAVGQPGSAERLVLVYGIGGSSRIYISHFSPGTAAAESATSW